MQPIRDERQRAIPNEYAHAFESDLPTSSEIYQRAAGQLQTIPENAIAAISNFEGRPQYGDLTHYVTMPDGTSYSQGQFLAAYARLNNLAVTSAQNILGRHQSLADLKRQRDTLEASLDRHSDTALYENLWPASESEMTVEEGSKLVDTYLQRRVIHLSQTPTDQYIRVMGYNLALMNLEHAQSEASTASLLKDNAPEIEFHLATMQSARENADARAVRQQYKDLARTTHERAFLTTLDQKLSHQGYIPPLMLINDMDSNLGVSHAKARLKPGNIVGQIVDELDAVYLTPMHQRFPITDDLELHPVLNRIAGSLLYSAGYETTPFTDVATVIETASANNVPFSILTANLQTVPRGLLTKIGADAAVDVLGAERDYREGFDKPTNIVKTLAQHPDAVLLFSDDADLSSVEGLTRDRASDIFPMPLQDLVFFASRNPDPDGKTYRLQQKLAALGIPYAENQMTPQADGSFRGYQGVQRDLELYLQWRALRLQEGWPLQPEAREFSQETDIARVENWAPTFDRHIVLSRSPDQYLPTGELNWRYWVGTAGITRDPHGRTVALYKGINEPEPGTKAVHNHGLAILGSDGHTIVGEHPFPVLHARQDQEHLYPHGFEDARATRIGENQYIIVATAFNKNDRNKDLFAHKDQRLRGAYAYAFFSPDPSNPDTYEPLGQIGPDFYMKNVFLHSEIIDRGGVPHFLMFYRDLPNVQATLIPVADFYRLAQDDEFREAFWENELSPEVKAAHTILEPLFPWEAKGNIYYPQGQLAGGGSPLEVTYADSIGRDKKALLFIYNSASGFDSKGETTGYAVGACLLDPATFKVISRSPLPILVPETDDEINGRYRNIVFTIGNEVAGDELRVYYTGGDQHLKLATCSADEMVSYLRQFDARGQNIHSATSARLRRGDIVA